MTAYKSQVWLEDEELRDRMYWAACFRRAGGRVRCIDANQAPLLRAGRVYAIAWYHTDGLLELKDVSGVYGPRRFEPAKAKKKPAGPPPATFQSGDLVRCKQGCEHRGVATGGFYTVARVSRGRLPMLTFREPGTRPMLSIRFELVDQTPYTLDQYGPALEDPDPIFLAIDKKWSNHPSDAVLNLNELDRDK